MRDLLSRLSGVAPTGFRKLEWALFEVDQRALRGIVGPSEAGRPESAFYSKWLRLK